jgi:signal transduction histidine kinase
VVHRADQPPSSDCHDRESALLGERDRLRKIFEHAPEAICILDVDHRITDANASFRALLPPHDPIGLTLEALLPELVAMSDRIDLVRRMQETYKATEVVVRLFGKAEPSYLNFVCQPLADEIGHIDVLVRATDVTDFVSERLSWEAQATELEELTGDLRAANGELDRFAYVTSHDLRAPLRGIANLAHWIEEDLASVASLETREHLQLLQGRVRSLEAMIDGILQYSRAGRCADCPERIDVGRLVTQVIDLLAPPHDARFEVRSLPTLETDLTPLRQVLHNLLANAIAHGRGSDGLDVLVSAEKIDGCPCISIVDRGAGIDPRFHDRIWGIFQRLSVSAGGTGIGLSLVRKIVEGRGGRAWVESTPGAGASFRFTWPEKRAQRRGESWARSP